MICRAARLRATRPHMMMNSVFIETERNSLKGVLARNTPSHRVSRYPHTRAGMGRTGGCGRRLGHLHRSAVGCRKGSGNALRQVCVSAMNFSRSALGLSLFSAYIARIVCVHMCTHTHTHTHTHTCTHAYIHTHTHTHTLTHIHTQTRGMKRAREHARAHARGGSHGKLNPKP